MACSWLFAILIVIKAALGLRDMNASQRLLFLGVVGSGWGIVSLSNLALHLSSQWRWRGTLIEYFGLDLVVVASSSIGFLYFMAA